MAQHVYSLSELNLATPSMVTIGVFDGVHLGHQWLVKKLVQQAHDAGLLSVVLTFFPHPDVVLRGVADRYYLTTPEEKANILIGMGVDLVITQEFNDDLRLMRATAFVDQLCQHLRLRALWVGQDFAMGYQREGNVAFLRQQGRSRGFTVDALDLQVSEEGRVISSSAIRDALQTGDVALVADMLGRPYQMSGEVVTGAQRGRTIGFPTANVQPWSGKMLPVFGVYACWAYLGEKQLMAVVNIGVQPTFEGDTFKVEAHLLDFKGDIYGQEVRLEFLQRIRAEKQFSGIDELVAQITDDVEAARAIFRQDVVVPGKVAR